MKLYESAVVAGVAIGGIYALIAIGITQIFKVTRVLNFAHAGFMLWGAYLYAHWAPAPPAHRHMPTGVAALLAVLCTTAMGVVLHFVTFRIARRATNIGKIIATLGAFQAMLAAAVWVFGQAPVAGASLIPSGAISVSKTNITWTQLANLGIALAVALAFGAVLRYTRLGLLTRAVTEDPDRAEFLLGARRDLIGSVNWALAAGLGGLAGVLFCSIGPFTNDEFFTYFTVALLATMVGALQSLPLTVLGAVVLGVVDTVISVRFTAPNASDAALFAVFAILVLVRRKWPSEVTQVVWTRPNIAREGTTAWSTFFQWTFLIAFAYVMLSVYAAGQLVWATTADLTIMYALAAISIVPILGWTGQVSLATPGIMAISAYVAASLATADGLPYALAIVIALIVGTMFGAALGALTSRIGFVLTAVMTLAFTNGMQWLVNSPIFPGYNGSLTFNQPDILGNPMRQYVLALFFALIVIVGIRNVRESPWGPRIIGTKFSSLMVESFGERPLELRIYAYALSGAIAALAGILYGVIVSTADATAFTNGLALTILQYAVIGGVSSVWGPFIAVLIFVVGPQLFGLARYTGIPWTQVASGLVVIGLVSLTSDGILSLLKPPLFLRPRRRLAIGIAKRLHVLPVIVDEEPSPTLTEAARS